MNGWDLKYAFFPGGATYVSLLFVCMTRGFQNMPLYRDLPFWSKNTATQGLYAIFHPILPSKIFSKTLSIEFKKDPFSWKQTLFNF